MSDPSDCAFSIAAMVKDWYASPHKSDIPATLIDRRMARFQPSPALAALAMRERAAAWCDTHAAYITEKWGPVFSADVHRDIAETIRALPTTFTDAELLAAVEQFPAVRALVEAASHMVSADAWSTEEYRGTRPEEIVSTVSNLLYAIAPFRK